MMRICVITDNEFLYGKFKEIIMDMAYAKYHFEFYYSWGNKEFGERYKDNRNFLPINLREEGDGFYSQYDLFLSLHCKQLFPGRLVDCYRCVNVHPGYNPYNRGWFPQVFSILNQKPAGVTIHEMDRKLDHGAIICQEYVPIHPYDTSWNAYKRIQDMEVKMLDRHLIDIIEKNYITTDMLSEGNVNTKADFEKLCLIDLGKKATYGEVIDLLRATTFAGYDNAYFMDQEGNKIYVSISLKKADDGTEAHCTI